MENSLVCADSLEHMKTLPDDSFDCCFTDPPGWLVSDNGPLHYSYYYSWLKPFLVEVTRLVKPGGLIAVFQNQMYFSHMWELFPRYSKVFICAKTHHDFLCEWQERDSDAHFRMQYDPIMMWYNSNDSANFDYADYFLSNNEHMERNTRPVDISTYILKNFSHGRILDPFCGRGTTLVTAEILERPYYGIDIDPEAVKASRKGLCNVK